MPHNPVPVVITTEKEFIEHFGKPPTEEERALANYRSYEAMQRMMGYNPTSMTWVKRVEDNTEGNG